MKYIIYCRKSSESEDKQALSIESQESEMLQIAEKLGLEIFTILKESKSAKQPGRPVFSQMIKMIESKKADGILCWKLDRLARNPIDGGNISWLLQKGLLNNIKTFDRDYYPTDNVLMMAVEFGMSNQYIRDLSANVKRGNRTKLERGDWHNMAPIGYLNDKANNKVVVDPIRSKYVKRAFELYSTGGYAFNDIAHLLKEEGFCSRSGLFYPKGKILKMFFNPFYYGVMKSNEKLYNGNHIPIISKTLFDKVHEVMEKRGRPHAKNLFFPLRGFITCEDCGCMYTATLKKGHDYYYCTNGKNICVAHKRYMRENDIYEKIVPILESLAIDPELVDLAYEAEKQQGGSNTSYIEETLNTLNASLKPLVEKESRLLDAFLDKSIDKEIYDKKKLEIQNEIFEIKRQIKSVKNSSTVSTLEPTKKLFLDCIYWANKFKDVDSKEKHEIIKTILWNLSMKDKNIYNCQLKSPYNLISKLPKNATFDELRREGDSNSRYDFSYTTFPGLPFKPLTHLSND